MYKISKIDQLISFFFHLQLAIISLVFFFKFFILYELPCSSLAIDSRFAKLFGL